MSYTGRAQAPTVDEIEKRFRSIPVRVARPIIHGGIAVVGAVRGFSWTSIGAENLAGHDPPLIFVSNHCSHADTAAIHGTLPKPIRKNTTVAAALDVFGPAGFVHRHTLKAFKRECLQLTVAAWFHAFAFDRHGPPLRSLRTAQQLIEHGWSLLMYPEGTRSRSGEMAPFRSGIGILAKRTGRPVVPIHVSGGAQVLPCGAFLPKSGEISVQYGPALMFDQETPAEFTSRLENSVRQLATNVGYAHSQSNQHLADQPT